MQLHRGFTFDDLANLAGYLADLGITQAYCSPILQAAAGSTHGYDVVDPSRVNPELGGEGGYVQLTDTLHRSGLGQVLDIVPNHMAIDGRTNTWWWDVLANGPSSPYARYFDIDWDSQRKLTGRLLVPVLGDHYGRVLEAGELQVGRRGGEFVVKYFDKQWPLSPRSVDRLLDRAARRAGSDTLAALAKSFGQLPHALISEPDAIVERYRDSRVLTERLGRLLAERPAVATAVHAEVAALNADPDELDTLLQRQNYRLAFWRTASEELDYRRFFNIETLVGLRVEDEGVFADTHALILALVAGGSVNGLRVDHVDGLRDPETYLARLRDGTGGAYVVVEKILALTEDLPDGWPIAGTTGYDFLNDVNELFVDGDNEAELTAGYSAFIGDAPSYPEAVHAAKMQIMGQELAAEVERLVGQFAVVCERHRRHRDYTRRELREGLKEVLAAFPVYRTYVRPGYPPRQADREYVNEAICEAGNRRPDLDPELFTFLGRLLLLEVPGDPEIELALRFQQVSPPVMAKGVEDTVFYRYHRLASLNEVGGEPDSFGRDTDDFHRRCERAADEWPDRMLTLSTHDTKRGADVRARLNVLSEIPGPWHQAVSRWAAHNDRYRTGPFPDRNTEYLLYQSLVGAWPIDSGRLGAYIEKATKEAKVHTSWVDPVPAYDNALQAFVVAILGDEGFVDDLEAFLSESGVLSAGRTNSLAQTTLLLTCPGVADVYQGTELWDLSLVDPDNRRPVDYELRRRLLDKLRDADAAAASQLADDGGTKLWLIHRLLDDRRRRPEAYADTGYQPLMARGSKAAHVVAFQRRGRLVVVVPRLVVGLRGDWEDTVIDLPEGEWTDVLTGAEMAGRTVSVAELLAGFPVAVLADRAA